MIRYVPGFISDPNTVFEELMSKTDWIRIPKLPRSEYWCNDFNRSYTYGSNAGARTYDAQPWTGPMRMVRDFLHAETGVYYQGCFANFYHDSSDHLGWHSDADPGIDHSKPIAIVSLGAEREIWFREIGESGTTHDNLLLQNGSLAEMPPGYQFTHQHRIPKAPDQRIGPRISLTFRALR